MKFFFAIFLLFLISNHSLCNEVNIFTSRHYQSDKTLYKIFTQRTGINVNIISGKSKAIEKRIEEEGKDCKGDLFIAADAGRLHSMEKKGLLQKINSRVLETKIPSNLRTPFWFGITKRARVFFYDPASISSEKIKNLRYEDLSNPEWEGELLIRSSSNIYNQSLVASLIENNGIEKTKKWAKGVVKNMARMPQGNDRAQILGIVAGEGKIAVANTYYYALMMSGQKGEEQKKAAQKLKPFFPNQNDRGTHINISGAGILKYSKNKQNTIKLLEFLLSEKAQEHMVNNTFEYPIIEGVKTHKLVTNMGLDFKKDTATNVYSYGKWQAAALKLMIEVGWK